MSFPFEPERRDCALFFSSAGSCLRGLFPKSLATRATMRSPLGFARSAGRMSSFEIKEAPTTPSNACRTCVAVPDHPPLIKVRQDIRSLFVRLSSVDLDFSAANMTRTPISYSFILGSAIITPCRVRPLLP